MIKYLKHSEIDVRAWDKCIDRSFNGIIYATSWYLDLVHEGWEALVENDYERVMPLTGGRKFGIDYLYQPYFTQQLGIFSQSMLNPEVVNLFIEHLPAHLKFVDINMNSFNKIESPELIVKHNKNHILDLINEHDKIASKYSTQTKRNLKKSHKSGLSLMKNIKPEAVITLFRENRGKDLKKWNDKHYNILKRLMYSAIFKGKGVAYGVFTGFNELCAGAFFLKSSNRLIFLFSGTDKIARETSALTFLIDAVIEEYAPIQAVLDFEGSNDPDLARYYSGFGAKEIEYARIKLNRLAFPSRQFFNVYKSLKKS